MNYNKKSVEDIDVAGDRLYSIRRCAYAGGTAVFDADGKDECGGQTAQ